jgi:hypothetical protein
MPIEIISFLNVTRQRPRFKNWMQRKMTSKFPSATTGDSEQGILRRHECSCQRQEEKLFEALVRCPSECRLPGFYVVERFQNNIAVDLSLEAKQRYDFYFDHSAHGKESKCRTDCIEKA